MFWIPNQLEGAYVGQDVTLECHSEAFPKSINYWVREDDTMLISGKNFLELPFLIRPSNRSYFKPVVGRPLFRYNSFKYVENPRS